MAYVEAFQQNPEMLDNKKVATDFIKLLQRDKLLQDDEDLNELLAGEAATEINRMTSFRRHKKIRVAEKEKSRDPSKVLAGLKKTNCIWRWVNSENVERILPYIASELKKLDEEGKRQRKKVSTTPPDQQ